MIDGELSVVSDSGESVEIGADSASNVQVTVDGVIDTSVGPFTAASVERLVVQGGDLGNVLDLSQVFAVDYAWSDVDGNVISIEVTGGNGHDELTGAIDLGSSLYGGHGDDTITVLGGDVLVDGGHGNDTIDGGSGSDTLLGGDGNDVITGGPSGDSIDGGDGMDSLDGGIGDDTLQGGDGADRLDGGTGNDSLNGSSGDDLLIGNTGDDTIRGGSGSDSVYGDLLVSTSQAGDDSLFGQGDADKLYGGGGVDSINGGPGHDLLHSMFTMNVTEDPSPTAVMPPRFSEPSNNQPPTVNDDFAEAIQEGRALVNVLANDVDSDGGIDIYSINITSQPSNGTVFVQTNGLIIFTPTPGFFGTDSATYTVEDYFGQVSVEATLTVETTAIDALGDTLSGSSGNDTLYGNFGNDTMFGGSGNDEMYGLPNNDRMNGQAGHDTLCGGGGSDQLRGQTGNDLLQSVCLGPGLAGPEFFVNDPEGFVQNTVDVLMILDISGSTNSPFQGSPVGDLNNDGNPDTVLDAEIAGFIALNDQLVSDNVDAQVGIIAFDNNAYSMDMDLATVGFQLITTPTTDVDGNAVNDVEDVLRTLQSQGFTNFEPPLQAAEAFFTTLATQPGAGVLVFLSDGDPFDVGAYSDEVTRLNGMGIDLRAFGVGAGASLTNLQVIDPTATRFQTTNELLTALGGLGISTTSELPFLVDLTKWSSSTILVDYATVDGTAMAGVHYEATSGTLTFQPGDMQNTVTVLPIVGAPITGGDYFFLQLSNPRNAVINDGQGRAEFQSLVAPWSVDASGNQTPVGTTIIGTPTEFPADEIARVVLQAEQSEPGDYLAGQLMVAFDPDRAPLVADRQQILAELGGTIVYEFEYDLGAVVQLDEPAERIVDDVIRWTEHAAVLFAEPNYVSTVSRFPNDFGTDPDQTLQWGLHNTADNAGTPDSDIDAPEAWELFTGTDQAVVAVVDTGVFWDHPDLADNMWTNPGEIEGDGLDNDGNGYIDDFRGVSFDAGIPVPMDIGGHGTHVAGIIGAVGDNGQGVTGVNWDVEILPIRASENIDQCILDPGVPCGVQWDQGFSGANIISSLDYVWKMKTEFGVNIVATNHSHGASYSLLLKQAIQRVIDADIVVVAAAGNGTEDRDSDSDMWADASLDGVINVAATDHNDSLANYSAYGATTVDLAAPGGSGSAVVAEQIRSTVPDYTIPDVGGMSFTHTSDPTGYSAISGTSMAAPMVTGAVALLRGFNPSLTAADTKQLILDNVDQLSSLQGLKSVLSGGRLNLEQALRAAASLSSSFVDAGGDLGDTMLGHAGRDTLIGADGDDRLNGGTDRDVLSGGGGADLLMAGSGDDLLNGDAGNDTLDGQGGADLVFGDAGDDVLVWQHGAGSDNLEGGDGYDVVHARDGGADSAFSVGENLLDLTYQMDARMQLADGTHTTNVGFSIAEVEFQPGDGDDTVIVTDLTHVPSLLLRVAGGPGNDVLSAAGADPGVVRLIFDGEAGNDTITGSVARDTIRGGDGDDLVLAGAGRDTVYGGDGDDVLNGNDGDDVMYGGVGFDTLNGDDGDDVLVGNEDRDLLVGGNGDDVLSGDQGRDTLNGKAGNDSLLGGEGTDRIYGGVGNDTLDGGRDNDSLYGNNGDDRLLGDHGDDSMKGGRGDDTLVGGDGHDQMFGERGDDQLGGGDGDDTLNGARGDDILLGGDGDDTMLAGSGADIVLGNQGDDYVKGQGGSRDTIAGGEGVDLVFGSVGEIDEAFRVSAALMSDLDAV
jgi:Ca2+-binding RTX toxin-like protein